MKTLTKALLLLLSLAVIPALINCSGGGGGGGGGGKAPLWKIPKNLNDFISVSGFNSGEIPQVATDSSGNTIIVWSQYDGSNYQIFKAEYRNKKWTFPADETDNISPDGSSAQEPRVAMDDNGNAIITWLQYDQTTDCSGTNPCIHVFKSEYRSGTWNNPALIANNISPGGSNAQGPRVAMDNLGNAVITWYQNDQTGSCGLGCTQIFKAEYRGGVWDIPVLITNSISPDGTLAYFAQVAMNDNGKAILTWVQYDNDNDCWSGNQCRMVYMTMYNGSSWSTVSDLPTDHVSPPGEGSYGVNSWAWPAMDSNDNAIIAWAQYTSANDLQIYRSMYNGTDWTHPGTLANAISPSNGDYNNPTVAMSDDGTAMITWYGDDDSSDCSGSICEQIFTSVYNGTDWTDPADPNDNISPGGGYAYSPQVAMDNNGNAVVTWPEEDGAGDYQIFKAEYSGGTWKLPADLSDNISPDGTSTHTNVDVSMYGNNKAVIVWAQEDLIGDYLIFKAEKR